MNKIRIPRRVLVFFCTPNVLLIHSYVCKCNSFIFSQLQTDLYVCTRACNKNETSNNEESYPSISAAYNTYVVCLCVCFIIVIFIITKRFFFFYSSSSSNK